MRNGHKSWATSMSWTTGRTTILGRTGSRRKWKKCLGYFYFLRTFPLTMFGLYFEKQPWYWGTGHRKTCSSSKACWPSWRWGSGSLARSSSWSSQGSKGKYMFGIVCFVSISKVWISVSLQPGRSTRGRKGPYLQPMQSPLSNSSKPGRSSTKPLSWMRGCWKQWLKGRLGWENTHCLLALIGSKTHFLFFVSAFIGSKINSLNSPKSLSLQALLHKQKLADWFDRKAPLQSEPSSSARPAGNATAAVPAVPG